VIDVFEQQSSVGGVWVYSPDTPKGKTEVPQTNPFQPLEEPTWHYRKGKTLEDSRVAREPTFISPMYDRLETNIPRCLMKFSDKPFPKDEQLFPGHESVLRYLEEHAEDVMHLVQFNTQVLDVSRRFVDGKREWSVKTKKLISKKITEKNYDAVVIASGHYKVPFVPEIKGIKEWNKAYPRTISHSKFYKTPSDYCGKKVLIVGYSASGVDIASQISTLSTPPLLISQRSPSLFSPSTPPWATPLPEIIEFLPPSPTHPRAIRFADNHTESHIDAVLFCTGYLYSFPFLSSLRPQLIHTGERVQNLYKHLLYTYDPTLAFIGLPFPIIPFRTCESQAAVIARVWSGRLDLPSRSSMSSWENGRVADQGSRRRFHALNFPQDFDYHNALCDWAMEAKRPEQGKLPPKWSEKERWARGRFPAIKKAFVEKGEGRRAVRTMEELGFVHEQGVGG